MSSRSKFWLLTAAAVLCAFATLALGRWQLSRAEQKLAVQDSIHARAALPALDNQAVSAQLNAMPEWHRRVSLQGRWMGAATVFLDNRPMNNKPGLYVVTPMRLEGSTAVILVQRGWVARNFVDRTRLPPLKTPAGVVEIQGRMAPPPASLYELGGPDAGRIRQNLDVGAFSAELGVSLLAVSVQQTGPASEGLLRDWPLVASGVDKHYGYAFQWFGLSGLIAFLYVWFQIVKRFIYPQRA